MVNGEHAQRTSDMQSSLEASRTECKRKLQQPAEQVQMGIRLARGGRYQEALGWFRRARQSHLLAPTLEPPSFPPDSALAFAMGTHCRLGSGYMSAVPAELVFRVVVACGWRGREH